MTGKFHKVAYSLYALVALVLMCFHAIVAADTRTAIDYLRGYCYDLQPEGGAARVGLNLPILGAVVCAVAATYCITHIRNPTRRSCTLVSDLIVINVITPLIYVAVLLGYASVSLWALVLFIIFCIQMAVTLLVYSAIIHGIVVGMNKNGHGPLMFALKMSVHNLLNVTPAEDDQGSDTSVASKA